MTTDVALKHNGETIDYLRESLSSSEHGMSGLSTAIRLTIKDRAWMARRDPRTGQVYECASFAELVTAPPLKGLGWSIADLKRFVKDDPEALDIIDQETVAPHGGTRSKIDNIQDAPKAPTGTSVEAALRRLRKDRPDLHNEVIRGRMSPHAAMVEAGFRPKTATVRINDPDAASKFLATHFEPDDIRRIADLAVHLREGME